MNIKNKRNVIIYWHLDKFIKKLVYKLFTSLFININKPSSLAFKLVRFIYFIMLNQHKRSFIELSIKLVCNHPIHLQPWEMMVSCQKYLQPSDTMIDFFFFLPLWNIWVRCQHPTIYIYACAYVLVCVLLLNF